MLFHSRTTVQLLPRKINHLKWYRPVPPVADAVNLIVVPEACGLARLLVRPVIRIEPAPDVVPPPALLPPLLVEPPPLVLPPPIVLPPPPVLPLPPLLFDEPEVASCSVICCI